MKQKINCKIIIPKRYDRILKIMKISTLFLFLCVFCALGENIYSQNNEISLNLENVSTKDAFTKIEQEAGYVFIFNEDVEVRLKKSVTINVENKAIEAILAQLLKGTGLDYRIIAKQVTLYVNNRLEKLVTTTSPHLLTVKSQQQGKTIKGKVIDEHGEPLPGVTIVVKGTAMGTTTDIDGNYMLQNIPGSPVLVFSFVGMQSQEITVGNRTTINVTMQEEAIGLEEVVAVGYGVQRKESVVGAISQASSKELMRRGNVADLRQALSGQLPGLVTITSSGEPGGTGDGASATSIFIRGQNTWNGGQPLILVDGVERDMSNVDVNEVQNVSILKDASATAVFGVKGANGVILITTKRGERGKPNISFSYNTTAMQLSKVPERMDSYQAILTRNEAIEREVSLNEPSWQDYIPFEIAKRYQLPQSPEYVEIYPNVDWEKAMFKDVGFSHKATLNVSGGNNLVRYFGSLSYLHEGDMFKDYENFKNYDPNYDFDRFNFRSNLDFQITGSTTLKMNLSGYYSQKNKNYSDNPGSMWAAVYGMPPDIYLPQYSDGRWGWSLLTGKINPVAVVYNQGLKQIRTTSLLSDFEVEQNLDFITKGLVAKASFYYDNTLSTTGGIWDLANHIRPIEWNSNTPEKYVNSELYTGPDQDPNEYIQNLPILGYNQFDWALKPWELYDEAPSGALSRRMVYQLQINYARKFGLHSVGAMGVMKREEYASGNEFKHYREDWVSRATYDYDTRYFLEFNGAYNGSEQFGPGYRFDFFPSMALGWYVSNEKFFKPQWINKLKLRYSLGYVGDDRVSGGRWLYASQYSYGGFTRLNQSPRRQSPYTWYSESSIGNPDIHWEKAQKQNFGVELGIFNNLLTIDIDYFREKRTDILLAGGLSSIPPFFGGTPPTTNSGRVNSAGYEVETKFNKRISNDFHLWTTLSFTHIRNKVIFKDDPLLLPDYLKAQGYPIGQSRTLLRTEFYNNWDEVYASVPMETNDLQKMPGFYNLLDFNADGYIRNSEDVVPYGYPGVPENTYNLSLGLNYKGFSAMAQLYGVNNVSRSVPLLNFYRYDNIVFSHVRDYWSKDNQNATSFLPRWKTGNKDNGSLFSIGDYYLYDASFIRLKTIEIAYTFDKTNKLLKNSGLSSLRVYLNGNNLFFWSRLPDDREAAWAGGSASSGTYPTVKRINLGIDINF